MPEVVPREQWLTTRLRLLEQEQELTRRRDALNAERRRPNYDFAVTLHESAGQLTCNYRPEPGLIGSERSAEMPGASCFLRHDGEIFHTYYGLRAWPGPRRHALRPD